MNFGDKIKELRESKMLLQRQLAASLEIDTPMYSKIERGERNAKREQVILLAELLNADVEDLLSHWLAAKVYNIIKGEVVAMHALKVAEERITNTENEKKSTT